MTSQNNHIMDIDCQLISIYGDLVTSLPAYYLVIVGHFKSKLKYQHKFSKCFVIIYAPLTFKKNRNKSNLNVKLHQYIL